MVAIILRRGRFLCGTRFCHPPSSPSHQEMPSMNSVSRALVGFGALAVALCVISAPATADTPTLPKESYKKAADADLKFLQDRVGDLAKKQAAGMKTLDGQVKPALGVALMLSV